MRHFEVKLISYIPNSKNVVKAERTVKVSIDTIDIDVFGFNPESFIKDHQADEQVMGIYENGQQLD